MNLLFSLLLVTTVDSTQIKLEDISDHNIVRLLNNISIVKETRTQSNILRIMEASNLSGSANNGTCEVTTNLYFGISEFGEYPDQKLYLLSNLYNPEIESLSDEKDKFRIVVIYGASNERSRITLFLDMNNCTIQKQ